MTNSIKILLFTLLIGSIICSCGKDDSPPAAGLTILSPATMAEFDIYDTVAVKVLVKTSVDAEISISVQLMNESFVPVLPARIVENAMANTEQTVLYPISDSTLADGIYNLRIQAFGNIETAQAYRRIFINEIPQTLKSIWLVAESTASIALKVLSDNYQLMKEIVVESDYAGSAVSSANGQFYLAGEKSGNFTAFNGYNQSTEWFIPAIPNPNQPYFTFVRTFGDVCYTGFWQGQVIGYNKFGGAVTATEFNENTIPVDVFVHDAFLIKHAIQRSNGAQNVIETYFVQSGAKISVQNITFEPVGFTAPEFRKIQIFANRNHQAGTFLFDPTSGVISSPYEPFNLPAEKIHATAIIDNSKTLLAMEGGIYIYDYEKSITQINNLQQVASLTFNHLNQTILAAAGTEVYVMNLQGNVFFQFDAQMPLLDLHLFFSK